MYWVEILSRIQFAFTVSFHILFPAFSIGLSTFLMIFEALWLITKNDKYLSIVKFWTKVFALTFGMGVVSGIVMEFQFGANWAGFAEKVGPVLGSLFTYEVLTAFFIEAGALGIMIFGWGRINKYVHFLANFTIFAGVTLSAFWILSANSWMQTPDGVNYINGKFEVYSWYHVIFNPSVIPRYIHMLMAAYLSTLMVILGVSAYYIIKDKHHSFAKTCIKFSIVSILILSVGQLAVGDDVGREVHEHQPLKTAAIEGVWDTQKGAPFVVFAYPSESQEKNLFSIEIPKLASLINTHELDGELIGLKSVPEKDRPVVAVVFYSFRIMVGIGTLMILMGVVGTILLARKKLQTSKWFLRLCTLTTPLGFVAIITGWFTAEFGRQPWTVYNILRTEYSVSDINFWQVFSSLAAIIIVYFIIFGFFYFRYLFRIINGGPSTGGEERMPYSYFQSVEKTTGEEE
ncbi:cytochrome ubiquinol oxidase subunit I [Francisella philomiragia]|uniref:cytochrome ubiquinol oxidase subunit I n=1 Tax=Francisella philomiragia TaxID=28110 RepID=UPI0005ABEFA2|nr:cytochrome ubiquinol oxidase subunit I [Francisella philomiragia]MBK2253443.1 cytochrome ubiquinol oxidase subunit I [Francisella philomiragia]MBY7734548.1 cytochrome ubiquinol oxidase subunit I [Francisella philomiragia]